MRRFDAIVAGCGAMGSATSYHLANRGMKTLTIDRFGQNHSNGSSHGRSRIIRSAYFEDPRYVPLVRRSFELWRDIQRRAGSELLTPTAALMLGTQRSTLVSGALRSAKEHSIAHEMLDSGEVRDRFPAFRPFENEVALLETNAGILACEKCVQAHVKLAQDMGSEFHFGETMLSWNEGGVIRVNTSTDCYEADRLVFAVGPWTADLLGDLSLPLRCERQVVFWFEPKRDKELFKLGAMPVFIWETEDARHFYGIPDTGDGVKAAEDHGGKESALEEVDRTISFLDESRVRKFLSERIPAANGRVLSSTTCIYTNTSDHNFIVGPHPRSKNAIVVSACSGHGFKFSPVIGEVVADLLSDGRSRHDISFIQMTRFLR